MQPGAYAVALLNLLLLAFFACQSVHLPFCTVRWFQFVTVPDLHWSAATLAPLPLPARPAEVSFALGSADEQSHFLQWIKKDLSLWTAKGISLAMVEESARRYRECFGEVFRFQILNGTLWIDHMSERHEGWYPAKLGPGALAGKGKVPYGILSIMDALRHHPGQIPDVDAVLHTSDFPCMLRTLRNPKAVPPPMFGYNSHSDFSDIPFPDYSYWGHEYSRLLGTDGQYLHGWEQQFEFLSSKWQEVPVSSRIPQVMWRGRTRDPDFPQRDALRRRFMQCGEELRALGRKADADLFNVLAPEVSLHDTCDFRYPMYIESDAWVTNLKQKLACGSILMSNTMAFYEFFTRSLQPGVHYVEVDPHNVCEDTLRKVKQMNLAFDMAGHREEGLQDRGSDADAGDQPRLPGQERMVRPGNRRAPAVPASLGQVEAPPSQDGNWSSAAPWKIGAAGQQFLAKHVQMRHVRLYIRDVLKQYASMQTFKPRQSRNALCYTGKLLLDQFGFPFELDRKVVLGAYPWLEGWSEDLCPS